MEVLILVSFLTMIAVVNINSLQEQASKKNEVNEFRQLELTHQIELPFRCVFLEFQSQIRLLTLQLLDEGLLHSDLKRQVKYTVKKRDNSEA